MLTKSRPAAPQTAKPSPRSSARQSSRSTPAGVKLDDTAVVEESWLGRIATTDGLFVTDERQRIVSWSSAAQRMLGYAPEEVVGQPCYLVLMGREPDGHPVCGHGCPVTKNARRGRGTPAYEVTAQARDGSLHCLSNSVLVLDGPRAAFRVIHLLRAVRPGRTQERRVVPEPDAAAEDAAPIEALTRRELEVLRLFAGAATIDNVAEALSISLFTARNHISSIQRKLGARNRLEMVLIGMRAGLV